MDTLNYPLLQDEGFDDGLIEINPDVAGGFYQ